MWWFESNLIISNNTNRYSIKFGAKWRNFIMLQNISCGRNTQWRYLMPPPSPLAIKVSYLPHDSHSWLMIKFSKHENILMNNEYEYEKTNLIDQLFRGLVGIWLNLTRTTGSLANYFNWITRNSQLKLKGKSSPHPAHPRPGWETLIIITPTERA